MYVVPGGGVLDISLGGEVRRGPSYRDPVKTNIASSYPVEDRIPIFDTLFKTFILFKTKLDRSIP